VIEKLQDFPDNFAAYVCHGHLTKADYAGVIPHMRLSRSSWNLRWRSLT
jgi:hypothetical protein